MLKLLFSPAAAQGASAAIVILVSVIIGRQAAMGMGAEQWGWAALVLASSIALAVLVWAPRGEPFKAPSRDDETIY